MNELIAVCQLQYVVKEIACSSTSLAIYSSIIVFRSETKYTKWQESKEIHRPKKYLREER